MGALPKRRVTRTRRGMRRAHDALQRPNLVLCPRCKKRIRPHHVCPYCGVYRGVQVLEVEGRS
ncbi:MAG: 50S ribosomal protein L32 [Anaerolineae bacterium]|nr:50S ribosomal protein L32 [Thermoflexus sp.]MDW8064081.1 50S ribosomal protein L32 [Anaerolineae bacterium]